MDDSDRKSALLTPAQREFLTEGPDGENAAHDRAMKSRIRERIREGIKDLDTVLRYMDPEDIQTALELRAPDIDEYTEDLLTERGLQSAIGVVYLACLEREDTHFGRDDPAGWKYDETAAKGLEVAENRLGRTVKNVDHGHDIEHGDAFDELGELEASELAEHSVDELIHAKELGEITEAQFERVMEQKYGGRQDE